MEANLPENGTIITADEWDRPVLPKGAMRHWGDPGENSRVGHYVNTRSGEIKTVVYALPERTPESEAAGSSGGSPAPKARADVTAKGMAMIGDLRTDALHRALRECPIDDQQLIGLLVLALGARNVEVKSGVAGRMSGSQRPRIAEGLTADGVLTTDPETLRSAARAMLIEVLSCRENHSASGMGARHAGTAVAADQYLPSMATDEFLPCLLKGALEREALASELSPGPRAKDTRATIAERFKEATWIYPGARFEPTAAELEARANPASIVAGGQYGQPDGDDAAELDEAGDGIEGSDEDSDTDVAVELPDDDVTGMATAFDAKSDVARQVAIT